MATQATQMFSDAMFAFHVRNLKINNLTHVEGFDTCGNKRNEDATLLEMEGILDSVLYGNIHSPDRYELIFMAKNGTKFSMKTR